MASTHRERTLGMFPFNGPPDDNVIRPLGDDDERLLLGLVHKYGMSSLMCALTGLGESCKHMTVCSAPNIKTNPPSPCLNRLGHDPSQ